MGGTEPCRNDEGSSRWDLAHKFNMSSTSFGMPIPWYRTLLELEKT